MKMIMKMKMNGRMKTMRKVSEEIMVESKNNSWKSNNSLERLPEERQMSYKGNRKRRWRDVEGYMTFDDVEERDEAFGYLSTVADKLGFEVEKREDVEGDPEEDEEIGRGVIIRFSTDGNKDNDVEEFLNMIDMAVNIWPEDYDFDYTGYEFDGYL